MVEIFVDDDKFRCSICGHFLSRAPIRRIKKGSAICGRCEPLEYDFRDEVLERAFEYFKFPCMNQHCNKKIRFNDSRHEHLCDHRLFKCFLHSNWKGRFDEIVPHILDETEHSIQNKCQIKIKVNQSEELTKFAVFNDVDKYLVEYMYDSESKRLTYKIVCFQRELEDSTCCTVYIADNDQLENKFQKKNGLCQTYLNWDLGCKLENVLDLSCLIKLWENSKVLVVTIVPNTFSQLRLGIFNSHKCTHCGELAIGPTLCCHRANVPLGDSPEKLGTVGCRWCQFRENAESHERTCEHRMYKCLVNGCSESFTFDVTKNHLKTHNVKLITNIEAKLYFDKESNELVGILIDREVILFEVNWKNNSVNITPVTSAEDDRFSIELLFAADDPTPIVISPTSRQPTTVPMPSTGILDTYMTIKKKV